MNTVKSRSKQFEATINKAGINTRRVKVLGPFVHIDTFAKYEGALRDLMGNAGFKLKQMSDGIHLDDTHGFRMVFQLA